MAKEITIDRTMDAPRERVFKAWLTPDDLLLWFHADPDWSTPFANVDAKVGGEFAIGFKSPDGKTDFTFGGSYDEIVEPERIDFTIGDGRKVRVSFEEDGEKTNMKVVFEMENINSEEKQREGWTLMIDHLAEHLAK